MGKLACINLLSVGSRVSFSSFSHLQIGYWNDADKMVLTQDQALLPNERLALRIELWVVTTIMVSSSIPETVFATFYSEITCGVVLHLKAFIYQEPLSYAGEKNNISQWQ